MGNLTSTDMAIIFILIGVIVILVGIIIILDVMNKKKKQETISADVLPSKKEDVLPVNSVNDVITTEEVKVEEPLSMVEPISEQPVVKENRNRVEEIKYVEEDAELEKTNAKMELEQLKEELRRQEENKKMMESAQMKEEHPEELVAKPEYQPDQLLASEEPEPVVVQPIAPEEKKEEVSTIANAINEQLTKEEKEADLARANKVQEDLNELLEMGIDEKIALHEDEQEKKAIISVDEFNKISDELYDSNEVVQNAYQDEGDEPITIEELYNTREMKAIKLDDFDTIKDEEKEALINSADIKTMDDLPPIAMDKKFKSSPFISPVYGISETKESLELEQTANLDKLNDEIKKTNEFLKALKELQKNLD